VIIFTIILQISSLSRSRCLVGNAISCWQTLGNGQFKPCENSNPYIGKKNEIEYVAEFKVELVCEDDCIEKVIKALKQSHPYETPAYQYWKVEN